MGTERVRYTGCLPEPELPQSPMGWKTMNIREIKGSCCLIFVGLLLLVSGASGAVTQYNTTNGVYSVVTFNGTGTTTWTVPALVEHVQYLIVAGGGSGGSQGAGGGGGAGGVLTCSTYAVTPGQSMSIVVGAGGASVKALWGINGENSSFGSLIANGGGGGGNGSHSYGLPGGSGGGAAGGGVSTNLGGDGTSGQGYRGGYRPTGLAGTGSGGGGGAGAAGGNVSGANNPGNGGAGISSSITGTATDYAGGGGGAANVVTGSGGAGGGGAGSTTDATAGTNGLGGGGGGTYNASYNSGAGGSGVVILSYTTPITSWDYTTPGTYYWTCPDGVHNISVSISGGGGSGHPGWTAGGAASYPGSGGHAAEHQNVSRISVTPGTNYTLVVGTGGVNASYNTASNGGSASSAFGYSKSGGLGGSALTEGYATDGENGMGSLRLAFNGTAGTGGSGGVSGLGYGASGGGGASDSGHATYGGGGADGIILIYVFGYSGGNVPEFSADATNGKPGTLIHFTDLSTISDSSGLTYNWSFGDGTYSSTVGDAQHVYSYTGDYTVSLTLNSSTGEVSETKTAYVVITSQDITTYSVPRTVTLTCVDSDLDPISNVNVTATPLNFTMPTGWLLLYYGIDESLGIDTYSPHGLTGSDGSWGAPLTSSALYNFSFTKSGMADYSMTFYPTSVSYLIKIPTESESTPINEIISYTLYNATINGTAENFNVSYKDTSGGTSKVTLTVKNTSGTVIYTGNTTGFGTGFANVSSGALTHGAGDSYEYSFSAVQSQVGFVNQSYSAKWEGLKTLGAFPDWVAQWIGIGLIMLVGAGFGASSVKFGGIILPILAGFEVLYLRWITPIVGVSAFILAMGILLVVGFIKYSREQERKL